MASSSVLVGFSAFHLVNLLLAVIGNCLIVVAILRRRELRSSQPFLWIGNLMFAELVFCLSSSPFISASLLGSFSLLEQNSFICAIQGSLMTTSGLAAVFSFYMIAINRFFFLFKPGIYKRCFTLRTAKLMILGVWLLSFAINSINYTGLSSYRYDDRVLICRTERKMTPIKIYSTISLVLITQGITLVIYCVLMADLCRMRTRIASQIPNILRCEASRLVHLLCYSWILMFLCSSPYVCYLSSDWQFSQTWVLFIQALASVQFSFSPVFFVSYNRRLKDSIASLLQCSRTSSDAHEKSPNDFLIRQSNNNDADIDQQNDEIYVINNDLSSKEPA
nr:G protein-coupled receptor [Proales similis]